MDKRNNKGQFTKGNSGRPKGVKNKVRGERYQAVCDLFQVLSETIEEDLMTVPPEVRVRVWLDVMKHVTPSHRDIDEDGDSTVRRYEITRTIIKGREADE